MVPMWTTFLTYSLVDATGSTFFFEQASNIDDKFPATVFVILVTVTSFAIDYLYDFLFRKIAHLLYYDKPSSYTNIFSLTPQFIFLGIMKGLSEGGLQSFFRSQVPESLKNYGPPFGECVIGIGKFLSIVCILIFGSWFGHDIYTSHLDNYYAMLIFGSFVNLLIYWLVAYWSGDDQFSPEIDSEP
ncbi:protein NRT1/ PTR FAMILY 5.5-like [Olea europaea var. sylvestris]|uniref:protein NRT1/ PTR FAMILY 5.5-like n=1 Tax=Olea europaea var. sylvestris TaxID=158386 RepID=UPI000C1D04A2|nr:protein NRT1/ PTR FAMILY 5.5-like [Olea europaea var. sylvestris]